MSDDGGIFGPELYEFLEGLEANNNKEWFNENRERYEEEVREPAFDLIRAVRPLLEEISPHMTARDSKVGGSLMRVFRDTRFSSDKTPYKTNVGIQFRHVRGSDVHAPGYYVHLDTERCFFGAGSWMPDRDALAAYRVAIDENPDVWIAARDTCQSGGWRMEGERLKRAPRDWSIDHPMIEDLKRKSFIAVHDFDHDIALKPEFPSVIAAWCTESCPLMKFLCAAVGLKF
ncbi:TIGR02453 family protein [Candidatus Poriferisodalis sp.]|uniref:TIGR02453 family protein n=1 Tax=Candidatus Poriferisodalis sp. TaxID=3101277 RepID=UPI003B01A8E2